MYIDLLSAKNHLNINVKAIQIFGLVIAAYLTDIIDFLAEEAAKKSSTSLSQNLNSNNTSAICQDGSVILDRERIKLRTGLSLEDQYKIDVSLANTEILAVHPDDPDRISCNIKMYVSILTNENPDDLIKVNEALKNTKGTAKETKQKYMSAAVKNSIVETDPEILDKLKCWVDSMFESKGGVNKQTVKVFQETIMKYTTDKIVILKIIDIAIMRSYRDAAWAIEIYRKSLTPSYSTKTTPATRIGAEQKIGYNIKKDVSF